MDYKAIFKSLADLEELRRIGERVESGFYDKYEESGNGFEVYKVGESYIRLETYVGSYGGGFEITGITIVEPKTVKVTDFEPLEF